MENITRRQAAKAVAIGTAAAFIAPVSLASENPDAELLRLEVEYLKAELSALDASFHVEDGLAPKGTDQRYWSRVRELETAIINTPAHGPDGFAVKLRMVAAEMFCATHPDDAENLNERAAVSLFRDLNSFPAHPHNLAQKQGA